MDAIATAIGSLIAILVMAGMCKAEVPPNVLLTGTQSDSHSMPVVTNVNTGL